MEQRVDNTALKFNQWSIIVLNVLAFILGAATGKWLVLAVAVVLAVGTVFPGAGLFKLFYARVLRPAGILKPRIVAEDPAGPLFAQGMGAAFLLAAFGFLLAGPAVVGWVLAWMVVALALVNVLFDFCAGCFIYFQLSRRGLFPFAHR